MLDIAQEAQRLSDEIYRDLWKNKYVPAARAAAEEEAVRRSEHYVDAARPVGPWRLRPLTLRDVLLCEGYENPLLAPAKIAIELARPEHVWQFVWFLQPLDIRGDAEARDAFIAEAQLRHFNHRSRSRFLRRPILENTGELSADWFIDVATIVEFVTQHYADASFSKTIDPKTGRPRPSRDTGTHWVAGIVDAFASEYGWREADVLDLHLGRVWQYLRRIEARHNPAALIPSRVKAIAAECTAETERLVRERIAALINPRPLA